MFIRLFIVTFLSLISCSFLLSQLPVIPNFSFTDIDGVQHQLYENHLNQGKTVVIKFFFVNCPPCRANAPSFQAKNIEWGNNQNDTRFMELSILSNDDNNKVRGYKNTFGMTVISAGSDGNSHLITDMFKTGQYGPWYGTPSFAVIGPDKKVNYPVFFTDLEDAIAATGAEKPGNNAPDPTTLQLSIQNNNLNLPDGTVRYFLKSDNTTGPKYEIVKNSQGQYVFTYPSQQFPSLPNPVVVMETNAQAYHASVNSLDLLTIQKHILGLQPLITNNQKVAADVNGDTKINSLDLVTIRKVILGLDSQFPNGVKSFITIPSKLNITENPGQTVSLSMQVIKMGNVM